jgi:hypothetical protein
MKTKKKQVLFHENRWNLELYLSMVKARFNKESEKNLTVRKPEEQSKNDLIRRARKT